MRASPVLVLTRTDVARALSLDGCIAAVETALRLHAEGRTLAPGVLGVPATDGGFHIKAAGLRLDRPYFAAKVNANFPANPKHHRLPTIQGVIVLCDAADGRPLAVMDSIEITIQRTGAATAVAARHLARPDARVATVAGCGVQGRIQLRALKAVRPIEAAYAYDVDRAELAEVVAGRKPGRESATEIVVFDSTGTALQDVAAAAVVYERVVELGIGSPVALAD